MTSRLALLVFAGLVGVACGDDSTGPSGGGGAADTASGGTAGNTSAGSGGSPDPASSGSGPTTSGGEGGAGGGSSFACGELTCDGEQLCMISRFAAECDPLEDGDECPAGTSETLCGGDGAPCCCGETPEPLFDCVFTSGCEGEALGCSCLVSACEPGLDCLGVPAPRTFECGVLPPA